MAFHTPCRGRTKALMYSRGTEDRPWRNQWTRLALEGIQVMSMAAKKRRAHLAYCHAALSARVRKPFSLGRAGGGGGGWGWAGRSVPVCALGGGRDADGVGRERVSGAWCYGTVRGRRRGRGCGCCLRGDGDFRHLLVSAGRLGLDVVRSQRAGVEFQELLPPFVDGTTCAAIYEKGNENHDPGYLHVS